MDDRTKLVESLGKKIDRVLDDNRRLRSEALGLTSRTDRRTARLRVNRLLREIDGCIALMNK